MNQLYYARVTGRHISGKNTVFQLNNVTNVTTPTGSLIDRALCHGKYGWFELDPGHTVMDFSEVTGKYAAEGHQMSLDSKRQKLELACKSMVKAHQQLSSNDQAIVMNALSLTLSGTASTLSGIGAITSVLMGDFTGAFVPALISGVTGFIAYCSYDNMTKAMQAAYTASEGFAKALEAYHVFCIRNCPDHMKDLPMYDPEFTVYTKIVSAVLPHIKTLDFMYNKPDWSVA